MTLVVIIAGCGGGSGLSERSSPITKDPISEASARFLRPNSVDNKLVTFGSEAPTSEREAASKVLDKNLEARAAGNFAIQCATLDLSVIHEIVDPSGKREVSARSVCPTALKKLAEPLLDSAKIRADTLDGPVAALRVEGNRAYALYHGNDMKNYAMPMEKERGRWKVGALVTTELA